MLKPLCAVATLTLAAALSTQTSAQPAASAPAAKPTFYLIGDSTVSNGLNGWGDKTAIGTLFDPAKITVVNAARGGRSARSYYSEKLWDAVKNKLQPGDFVAMQFGTNDGGDPKSPTSKGRPDLPGIGDETTTATASLPANGEETVHTFGWYMKIFVDDTKAKGATPIMLTMVPHNAWKSDTVINRQTDTFVKWSKQVADAGGAFFIDLNDVSGKRFEKETPANMNKYFNPDKTHSTPAGALLNAESVVMGIRAFKDLKLNDTLSDAGKKLPPADAADTAAPK
jgi:rhamnogalacturonan acetylesterase